MRKNSGLTAFELAITLAIMTLVAALVMPPYLKWQRASRLRGVVSNILADLETARIKAIRENAFVVVQFLSDGYIVFVDNGAGTNARNWEQNADEQLVCSRELPAGVSIDLAGVTLLSKRTRFNGRGMPDITVTGTIPLRNASGNKQVSINRLGNLKVQ
jgi:type IV fimbrial biogenesis protein FimT